MARPREFDIDKAIEDMSEQFWAHGYEGTGISDLEEKTGLARASLYAAFGSKQNMLHQSIDFYLDNRIEMIISPIDDSGLEGAADFFRRFAKVVEMKPERASMGCLVVNSVVELGRSDSGVTSRAERYRTRIRSAFRSALDKAAEDGDVEGHVSERADLAYMMLMGLYVSVKGGASLDEVKALSDVAVNVVESWRVPSPVG